MQKQKTILCTGGAGYIGSHACVELLQTGNDYPTKDGTGVRDYIHVVDLAKGHLAAMRYLEEKERGEVFVVNLGTGIGYSVLDMAKAFEKASGVKVPYKIVGRRPGDIAGCFAYTSYEMDTMHWVREVP